MSEMIIKISEDSVSVEENKDGVKSYKAISPDSLLECINKSTLRGSVASGLLPKGCISFVSYDSGNRDICLLYPKSETDFNYYETEYKNFPLPRLVFGFSLTSEGHIRSCRLGVIDNRGDLKPNMVMYRYPFSNVSGYLICTGNNVLPKCDSPHTLASLPYYILAMPNNNDYFKPRNNQKNLEMRDLLEVIKDKPPEFYYSDILIPNGETLLDFINSERRLAG